MFFKFHDAKVRVAKPVMPFILSDSKNNILHLKISSD